MLKNFEKLALRSKLIIGFTIVLSLMIVIGAVSVWSIAVSVWSISNLVNTTQAIYEKDLIGISFLRQLNRDVNSIGRAANRYALAMNAGDIERAKGSQVTIEKTKTELLSNYEKAKATVTRPALKEKMDLLKPIIMNYFIAADSVLAAAQGKDPALSAYKVINSKQYQETIDLVGASIKEISGIINKINDISGLIASAVEEQAATTGEMGRSVSEAATSSADIASNINSVATTAQSTSEGAANSQQAAAQLAQIAGELQSLVMKFKV